MKKPALFKNILVVVLFCIALVTVILTGLQVPVTKTQASSPIQHVFLILMENHNWSQIKGSSSAPYINKTLLPLGGHAEQYYNPPHMHPSLPNYLWLEAGTNFGILNDDDPSKNHQSTTNHLVTLLTKAGLSWKAYEENISGTNCPLSNSGEYAVRHEPFTYFDDVTNNRSANSQNCIQHIRPFTQLATDLNANNIANYNFITPNLIDDMHDGSINQGDTWLSKEVPMIMNSQAFKNGVIIITWDEGEGGDGPIGTIVLSPFAKKNYSNTIHYTHSSTLKTMEEIFGVSPLLGDAAHATDLSDFFTGSITGGGATNTPAPSEITPTLFCLGASCTTTPSPSVGVSGSPSNSPSNSPSTSPAPSTSVTPGPKKPCKIDKDDKGNDKDKDSNSKGNCNPHKTKGHHHKSGEISKSVRKLLEELIKLLNQLLGLHLTLNDLKQATTPTPTVSGAPSPSASVSASPSQSGTTPEPSGTSPSPTND